MPLTTINGTDLVKDSRVIINSNFIDVQHVRGFGAAFRNDSGLTSGAVAYFVVPTGGSIAAWHIMIDAGTCTFKVWRVPTGGTALPTAANSINTSGLSISTGTVRHSTTLTDFTTLVIADGDVVAVTLSAVSGGPLQATLQVEFAL